jgi:hypothetical protein
MFNMPFLHRITILLQPKVLYSTVYNVVYYAGRGNYRMFLKAGTALYKLS